jgi:hypothetical protein
MEPTGSTDANRVAAGPARLLPDAPPSRPRRSRPAAGFRRMPGGWRLAAWTLAALAGYFVYLRLASTRAVNSDGASIALLGWDMLHGNLLLHGWTLADVSFYTTEIPQYALIDLARGLSPDVIHLATAMTYTVVVLFAALLAKSTATGREAVLRVALTVGVMLAPQLGSGTDVLLSSPDHTGTAVPIMAAWLIIDRLRPRWYVPVVTTALLAMALTGDMLVLVAGVIPLFAACAFRAVTARLGHAKPDRFELALGGGAIVATVLALVATHLLRALGGFQSRPLGAGFASPATIFWHNMPVVGQGLLLLGGADFIGLPATATTWFVVLHLAGVAVAAAGIAAAVWRFRRNEDLISQLLLLGIAVTVAAYALGTHAALVTNAREIAPVLPFAAALAGRHLAAPLLAGSPLAGRALAGRALAGQGLAGLGWLRRAALPALAVVLAGYLAGLGLELSQPSAPPLAAPLATWLKAHPRLGTGLSGFWEANVVAVTSGGTTAVHLVGVSNGKVVAGSGQTRDAWYDPASSTAHFVVLSHGAAPYPGFDSRHAVIATFGRPARTYHVGAYTILYWPENLIAELAAGRAT